MAARVILWRMTGLLASALLCLALYVYPCPGLLLPSYLLVYGGLLYHRPARLLILLPASLALLDLAPQTGWFFLEEIDLLLLLSIAICYFRLASCDVHPAPLAPMFRGGLWVMAIAIVLGLYRGLQPWGIPDVAALNDYLSPFNALRDGKSWLWAASLLPPLRRLASQNHVRFEAWLVSGMIGGLVSVSFCASYERYLFPGLLNLASDYRITAPFSAMHTGGAALDGYLAMTLPLLLAWLTSESRRWHQRAALMLLPLVCYAALATFSRGLYLAMASIVLIMLWGARHHAQAVAGLLALAPRHYRWSLRALFVMLLASGVYLLQQTFLVSGYRGLLAAAVVLLAAIVLRTQQRSALAMLAGTVTGMAAVGLLAQFWTVNTHFWPVFKPPYLLFLLASVGYPLALRHRPAVASILLGSLCGASGWISLHYAGKPAIPALFGQMAMCLLLMGVVFWRRHAARRGLLNQPQHATQELVRQRQGLYIGMVLLVTTAIPFYNGYFVAARFASVQQDLGARYHHWQDVVQVMGTQSDSTLLGAGLGRYPALYFWFNQRGERPPHALFLQREERSYLDLYAGHYQQGYGELLRVLQRVTLRPQQAYQLSLDYSGHGAPGFLLIRLCARQLLYPANCITLPQQTVARDATWQTRVFHFDSGVLGGDGAPIQLELAADGDGASVCVDNLSLIELATQRELLRNGNFSQLHTFWFFSSDHHHLPWHIKNLWLNLYFELGVAGLLAYSLLFISALCRLWRRARLPAYRSSALAWLASIMAFQIVGLFDSLIDVPRIALLSHLVLVTVVISPPTSRSRGQLHHERKHHAITPH